MHDAPIVCLLAVDGTCARGARARSLYPALHRLEHRGWIEAEWAVSELGRRAKYYRLTTAGRKQLTVETRDWERMANAIGRVMKLA
jgi:DNA-binding PadR family transcriptional regulator